MKLINKTILAISLCLFCTSAFTADLEHEEMKSMAKAVGVAYGAKIIYENIAVSCRKVDRRVGSSMKKSLTRWSSRQRRLINKSRTILDTTKRYYLSRAKDNSNPALQKDALHNLESMKTLTSSFAHLGKSIFDKIKKSDQKNFCLAISQKLADGRLDIARTRPSIAKYLKTWDQKAFANRYMP